MKFLSVIQARAASSRLPSKVMLDLCGKPLLVHMVERVQWAILSGQVIVATTTDTEDDGIVNLCKRYNIEVFRGHPTDLLDRHYQAAIEYKADAIIKIPSDCPLIDPVIIDRVLRQFRLDTYDYVSNLHPPSYPDGNDVEVFTMAALRKAHREAQKDFEREHTTPYIWDNPKKFNLGNHAWPGGQNLSMDLRFTIDYEEDYQFIRSIYEELYPKNNFFGLNEILNLLERKPELGDINKKYNGVNWYRHHLDDIKTISAKATRLSPDETNSSSQNLISPTETT